MDSVVDPETSGHCSDGTWRQGEMLAPKLRSRESRVIAFELVSLGLAQSELLSLGQRTGEKGCYSLAFSTAHSRGHISVHIPGYSSR